MISTQPLVFGFIFAGVFLAVQGLYLLAFGRAAHDSKVNRRLSLLESGEDPEDVLTQLRREHEQHKGFNGIPVISRLFSLAAQANLPWSPRMLTIILLGAIAATFMLLSFFTGASLPLRGVLAAVMGYAAIFLWLRKLARKRLTQFEEQLPDAVELMVRSLRVGHPFSSAVTIVAQEMPDPIGSEFGILSDEATYGMDVIESLEGMAERVDVPDLRYLAVAVMIQSQSGGNLAEILEGMSHVVRSRFKLFRKVKTITAEARFSGMFLSAFPLLALLVVQLVRPDYYDGVFDHPLFVPACVLVGVMLVINVIFMRMMTDIKV